MAYASTNAVGESGGGNIVKKTKPSKSQKKVGKILKKTRRKASKAASKGNVTKARKIQATGEGRARKTSIKAQGRKHVKAMTKAGAPKSAVKGVKKQVRQAVKNTKRHVKGHKKAISAGAKRARRSS